MRSGVPDRRTCKTPHRMTMDRHIVGFGGAGDTIEQTTLLHDHVLGLTGEERPRVLFVPTAVGDEASYALWFYERFAGRVEASTLHTFPWPPANRRELVLPQHAI